MQKEYVKISGYEDVNLIDFCITKEVNNHSKLLFSFSVGSDDSYSQVNSVEKKISVSNGNEYIFYGIINNISIDSFHSDIIVSISAISESSFSDSEKHKRIFQNPEKTIKSIFSYIGNEDNYDIVTNNDVKIEYPIIQANETDFVFLNRIASDNDMMLFVDDTSGDNNVTLTICSVPDGNTQKIEEHPQKLQLQKCQDSKGSYSAFTITVSDTYLNIGQLASFANMSGYIAKSKIYMEDYVVYYEYVICDINHICLAEKTTEPCRILLCGKVSENDSSESSPKGMIKVDFDCDYIDAEPDKKIWLPYRTPYTADEGGFIFVPDKDDSVQVIYSNNVMWAEQIFNDKPIKKEFCEFKNKYISNIYNKYIIFAEDKLELTANDTKITLTDDSITLLSGDSQICMNSNQITISVKDSKLVINDGTLLLDSNKSKTLLDKKLSIETNDQVTINSGSDFLLKASAIKGESKGDISLKASSNVKLSGAQIHLK